MGTKKGMRKGSGGEGKRSGNEKGSEGGKWWGREETWERKRE